MVWVVDIMFLQLANDLRDSDLIHELHARLAKIQNLTQQAINEVRDVHEDVRDIKQILAKTRRSAMLRSSDTFVQQMPLKPGVFHGRDDIIEEITQLLMKEETSRVCILGPGGMGKTSVSLGVVEQLLLKAQFLPENCVWVPCVEATSATLLLEILYIQLQIPGSKQVTIEKIISLLNTSTQPHLILLDNFETPYNVLGGTQKQVEDILRRLATLSHVAILLPCGEDILHAMRLSHGSQSTFGLLMKQLASASTIASIQIQKMIVMLVDCCMYWDTCLLLSHSWQDWPRKGNQLLRSYYLHGLSMGLISSLTIMNRA